MPPDFLISEFQTLLRPIEPLLTGVNRAWGFGIDLLLPALVFWLGGPERGFRAAVITAVSGSFNSLLKWTLALPRPFYVTDSFTPLKLTDGYGMPSGNAQGPASLLVGLAGKGPRWIWAVGVPLVVLAGVARIYYGVHSVNQVVVGWALGFGLAWAALAVERPLIDWTRRQTPRRRVGALLVATGLVFAVWYGAAQWSLHNRPAPPEWEQRFAQLTVELDEDETYGLVGPADAGAISGFLLGFGLVGLYFLSRGMPRLDRARERVLAVALGLPVTFLWQEAVGVLGTGLYSAVQGIGFALLIIPLYATIPIIVFLLIPLVAQRLGGERGAVTA